jgi:hypothetical protein
MADDTAQRNPTEQGVKPPFPEQGQNRVALK